MKLKKHFQLARPGQNLASGPTSDSKRKSKTGFLNDRTKLTENKMENLKKKTLNLDLVDKVEKDPRAALLHARKAKNTKYLDQCRAQNIAFIPLPADSFGVWEDRAAKEIVSIASVLATETGAGGRRDEATSVPATLCCPNQG